MRLDAIFAITFPCTLRKSGASLNAFNNVPMRHTSHARAEYHNDKILIDKDLTPFPPDYYLRADNQMARVINLILNLTSGISERPFYGRFAACPVEFLHWPA